jgi:preprotein translocase subunit SecB
LKGPIEQEDLEQAKYGTGNMSENEQPANGSNSEATEKRPSAQVIGQFIKDLSFENPNIERMLIPPKDKPSLNVEVNVAAKRLNENIYESAIEFSAKAETTEGVLYELELIYTGIFKLENMPQDSIEPVLLVNSPMLLFPFLRRIVADMTREGGFPPLFLDPIDFGQLYMSRKSQGESSETANT